MNYLSPYYSVLYVGIFALSSLQCIQGSKILFLIPISTASEKHFFEPLIIKLAESGHHVTVVASSPSHTLPKNVTEIIPVTVEEIFGGFADISSLSHINNDFSLIFYDLANFIDCIDKVYNSEGFKEITNKKYDLIFTNFLFGQVFYGIIYQNQSPFILLNSFPIANYLLKDIGLYVPPSTVPYPLFHYTDNMNFGQRLVNFAIDWLVYAYSELYYVPTFENIYRKHLGQDIPSVKEIQKNVSLVMMNSHFTSTFHRPLMPDIIEIGGIHCMDPKPLPTDLEEFVTASPHGFIYISFGTVAQAKSLPEKIRKKILNVFSRLKQRVLWKWENEYMEDLPSNVMLRKWLPQQDLLGHKNIRLFITHGGLLSTQQIIFHGLPALFLPLFFDQLTNARTAVSRGYGLELDIWNFTEEELETSIRQLINEPKFHQNAKTVSEVFRDQMQSPLERAIFWTNFVLKHDGAPQLRSSARNLNFTQLHSLDVIFVLIGILGVVFAFTFIIFIKIVRYLFLLNLNRKVKIH